MPHHCTQRFALISVISLLTLLLCACGVAAEAAPSGTQLLPTALLDADALPAPPPLPALPIAPTATPPPAPSLNLPAMVAGPILLRVDFDRPDLAGWRVIDATPMQTHPSSWRIDGGLLAQAGDADGLPAYYPTALVTGDSAWRDVAVNVLARAEHNEAIGLVVRAGGAGMYVFRVLPGGSGPIGSVLARYDAATGRLITLATAKGKGFVVGQWHMLTLLARGDELVGLLDGQEVISARDGTLRAGQAGVYGMAQGSLWFDMLTVTELDSREVPR